MHVTKKKVQVLPPYVHIETAIPGTYTIHPVRELGQPKRGESFLQQSYLVSHCKVGYKFWKHNVGTLPHGEFWS